MRKICFVLVFLVILGSNWAIAQDDSKTIEGRLSATDQEALEGYFAIDNETMIVVKPGSELHTYLKYKVGKRVRVTITMIDEPPTE